MRTGLFVIIGFLIAFSIEAQMGEIRTGKTLDKAPFKMQISSSDEVVGCWEASNLEAFLIKASEIAHNDETADWDMVLLDGGCTMFEYGVDLHLIGITADGDFLDDEYEGYEFTIDNQVLNIISIEIVFDADLRVEFGYNSARELAPITAHGKMWAIAEYLEENAYARN